MHHYTCDNDAAQYNDDGTEIRQRERHTHTHGGRDTERETETETQRQAVLNMNVIVNWIVSDVTVYHDHHGTWVY